MENHQLISVQSIKDNFRIKNLNDIKIALKVKHGNLTHAAQNLGLNYIFLSHVVNGRLYTTSIIHVLQSDLGLTDEQVLHLWPLLKTWPKNKKSA